MLLFHIISKNMSKGKAHLNARPDLDREKAKPRFGMTIPTARLDLGRVIVKPITNAKYAGRPDLGSVKAMYKSAMLDKSRPQWPLSCIAKAEYILIRSRSWTGSGNDNDHG